METPRKYHGFGTIQGVKRVLWNILRHADERLRDPMADDETKRGWANSACQAAMVYCKIHETSTLEERMKLLEGIPPQGGSLS